MVVLGQSGCITPKLLYSSKLVFFGQKWFYSEKNGCVRENVVLVGQNWLFSGKSCCSWAKVVVFWQEWLISVKNGCIRVKMLYSGKVVVFGQK